MVIKQREKASVFGKETHSTLFFLRPLLCSVPICILPIGPELEAEAHSYSSQQKKKRFCDAQAQVVLPWLPPNPAPASYPPRTRSNGHSNIRLEARSSPSDKCSSGPRAESTVYPHGLWSQDWALWFSRDFIETEKKEVGKFSVWQSALSPPPAPHMLRK